MQKERLEALLDATRSVQHCETRIYILEGQLKDSRHALQKAQRDYFKLLLGRP